MIRSQSNIRNSKIGDIIEFKDGYYTDKYIAVVVAKDDSCITTEIPHRWKSTVRFEDHEHRAKIIGDSNNSVLINWLNDPDNGKPIKNVSYLKNNQT